MKLKPFRGRVLESILIIAAVGVAAAAVTVVANLLAASARADRALTETIYARQITLQPKADDYEAFYSSVVPSDVREIGPKDSTPPDLAFEDLEAVKAAAPSVTAAYLAEVYGFNHQGLENSNSLTVLKVTSEFQTAAGLGISEGSLMSAVDFGDYNRVMLISPSGIRKLGLEAPVVGQEVSFSYEGSYTIIGVLRQTDAQDEDDFYDAFIPWAPSEWSGLDGIRQLTFSVAKTADVPAAQSQIRAYADKTWGEAVSVRSSAESNREYSRRQRTRDLVVAVFASLGLVTAALSIMSLMLARVLRRKREIGVRRSLGATRSAIRNQFLGEAALLGAVGGVLGVAAGYGLHVLYRGYTEDLYGGYGETFSVPVALGALSLALLVSLLFGLYPAVLASRVRIIEALEEA